MSSGLTPREAIAALAATFRQEKLSDATIAIYVEYLSDIAPTLLEASVRRVLADSRFFPSIAELRHAAVEIAGLEPPDAAEARSIIREADVATPVTRRDGTFAYMERSWQWPKDISPRTLALIRRVLEKVGEPRNADGEEYFGWETDFKQVYERLAGEMTVRALADLSQAALPEPPGLALPPVGG
jgi:hypothetical protein